MDLFNAETEEYASYDLRGGRGNMDVTDPLTLRKEAEDCSVIVHLAAMPGVTDCRDDPDQAVDTNIMGTQRVLEVARDLGARVIFASSAAAGTPAHIYGATKAAGEALCRAFITEDRLDVRILRLANVYGPGSWEKGSCIATWCRALKEKRAVHIHGSGLQRRDFVHVRDVARTILWHSLNRAIARPGDRDGDDHYRIYYVGTDKLVTVEDTATRVARLWSEKTGAAVQFHWDPVKITGGSATIPEGPEITGAGGLLYTGPFISLKEGLDETVQWFIDLDRQVETPNRWNSETE